MLAELAAAGKAKKLKGFEAIKAVFIETDPFRRVGGLCLFVCGWGAPHARAVSPRRRAQPSNAAPPPPHTHTPSHTHPPCTRSVENDLMTPSLKLKRPQLQKKYQPQIDAMYKAAKAPRA